METSRTTIQPAVLSVAHSASYLGVSTITIRRIIKSGEIPHVRVGNSIRIRLTDLDAYINSNTTTEWKPESGRGRVAKVAK